MTKDAKRKTLSTVNKHDSREMKFRKELFVKLVYCTAGIQYFALLLDSLLN